MSLQTSYRYLAPFYDVALERLTAGARRRSLQHLAVHPPGRVLLSGAGTGLDFPHLPLEHDYVALDLTPAMQARAERRSGALRLWQVRGDSMQLPFAAASFDHVVLHLILAVVPEPVRCLAEAERVLKPGGSLLLFDKFLRPGQRAPVRRALSPLSGRLATRLDVVFEELLAATPRLRLVRDEAALLRGWFRLIGLQKEA